MLMVKLACVLANMPSPALRTKTDFLEFYSFVLLNRAEEEKYHLPLSLHIIFMADSVFEIS